MNRPVLLLFFLLFGHGLAADYNVYCSSTNPLPGDGTSANPWQKLSSIPWNILQTLANGGTNVYVNLHRGSTWQEKLTIGGSGSLAFPITIQAYGTGAKPRIDGGALLTNWAAYGAGNGSVWVIPCTSPVVALFRNNELLVKGSSPLFLTNWQWCLIEGSLFLRDDTGNPDATGAAIYGLVRDRPFDCRSRQHLRVLDLDIRGAPGAGIYLDKADSVAFLRCNLEKSAQNAQIQSSSNICFTATRFGQSTGRGIYITGTNASAGFFFCLMSPGPSGGQALKLQVRGPVLISSIVLS